MVSKAFNVGTLLKRWRVLALMGLSFVLVLAACVSSADRGVTAPVAPKGEGAQSLCLEAGSTWITDNPVLPQGYCAKGTPAQCVANGGSWQRVCMMGKMACVQPYPDANKNCSTSSDCLGQRCLQSPEARGSTEQQTGRCITNNNPCYFGTNLVNGRPVPTAVMD